MSTGNRQYSISLACKLVQEQHGEVPSKVVHHLLYKGLQSLGEIIRGTELPPSQVRNALLILIQHNYVAAYLQKDEDSRVPKPPVTMYDPLPDRMLQIIRRPKFLLHISDEMGETGEAAEDIIQLLLENGRLTLEQIVKGVASKRASEGVEGDCTEQVRNVFMSLVQSHYVERCPPCHLPVPTKAPHQASVKTRGAPKPGSEEYAAQQAAALKGLETSVYERERYKLPPELVLQTIQQQQQAGGEAGAAAAAADAADDIDIDIKAPPAKKARMRAGSKSAAAATAAAAVAATSPEAAAAVAAAAAAAEAAAAPPPLLLWRVNNDEFNRRFRHKACVGLVRDKLDRDAGTVMAAMLAASRQFESSVRQAQSANISVEEVVSTTGKMQASGALPQFSGDVTDCETILRTVANDALDFLAQGPDHPGGGATYCANMGQMVAILQLKALEAMVRDRFGLSGLRIFRLLLIRGHLEQKQITDFAMLAPKETRELLYCMHKAGYLAMQDIPRSNDRAPSRSFYTWRVELQDVMRRMGQELYRGAANVWLRLKHEMEKEKEVLDLIEEAKEVGQLNFTLTAAQRQKIARLKRVSEVMEAGLMALDDEIAVFNDF